MMGGKALKANTKPFPGPWALSIDAGSARAPNTKRALHSENASNSWNTDAIA